MQKNWQQLQKNNHVEEGLGGRTTNLGCQKKAKRNELGEAFEVEG